MDSIEGKASQLASFQELVLWAAFAVVCVTLLMAGTYTGNSDIYDKIGREMKTFAKTAAAVLTSWRWAAEIWLRLAIARARGEYIGRHRPEFIALLQAAAA